jgi:uncharacterized membrane protein YfcA
VLAIIPVAVFCTAVISGIFGMAGGMILMAVYAAMLPVATAMVLHGATQLASNGSRAWLLRAHFHWPAIRWFAAGAAVAVAAFVALGVSADRATLLVLLGAVPVAVALAPTPRSLSIESPPAAVVCGAVVTSAQLLAGASGPLLDVFYVKSGLTRFQVIATKALTQAAGHAVKIAYYLWVLGAAPKLAPWVYCVAVTCAFAGTRVGAVILTRLGERQFRAWSGRLIVVVGLVLAARGVQAWLR